VWCSTNDLDKNVAYFLYVSSSTNFLLWHSFMNHTHTSTVRIVCVNPQGKNQKKDLWIKRKRERFILDYFRRDKIIASFMHTGYINSMSLFDLYFSQICFPAIVTKVMATRI
jgi:hypothetical protein